MTADIAALDVRTAVLELRLLNARIAEQIAHPKKTGLATAGECAEYAHMRADDSVWITNPPATTPATDATYPGWAERIARLAARNKQFRRAS